MPIDASIPLGIKQPDQMQNLSSLLSVAKGAQDVQTGGMVLNERKAMQQVLSDPRNYLGDDGNVDFDKAVPAIMRVAPTTGTQYVQGLMTAQKQHTEAVQAVNNLTTDNRMKAGSVLASIPSGAPADVVNKTLDALEAQYKGMAPITKQLRIGYQHALQSGGPGAVDDFMQRAARQVLPQETQQTMNTPTGVQVSDGNTTKIVNVKPQVAGLPQGATVPGTEAKQQLSPGQLENIEQDSVGNKYIVTRSPQGTILGTRPLQGAAAAPGGAPAPGPFTLPQGETPDTLKAVQNIRANANQSARTVPDQQFNANQIIKLADEADLGKGAQYVANMKGAVPGLHWTSDKATNYNQIGHYLALQTAQLAQSSGLGGTDAAHGIAAEQAGVREWTPDALKNATRVTRALSSGVLLFNQGVESAIARTNSQFAARDFQNAWSKTASVDALRLYDSVKNKADDPEGFNKTVRELGGADSDKFKQTLAKVAEMRKLIKGE